MARSTRLELDDLRRGVTVDGMEYGPIEARLDRVQGDNAWISLGLREGKNREVKRILEHLGLQVNRLIRLSFGPFQLGEIEEGMVEEIKTKILRDQLGDALAQEAGVDFESPVREPIAPFGTPAKADREEHHERPSRAPRERNEERPRGRREGDAREERPRFSRAGGERPTRDRGADARPGRGRDEEAAPKRPSRLETKTSIWRASDTDETSSKKIPRRGADPRAARAVAAERPRQRAAAIEFERRSQGQGRTPGERAAGRRARPQASPRRIPQRARRRRSSAPSFRRVQVRLRGVSAKAAPVVRRAAMTTVPRVQAATGRSVPVRRARPVRAGRKASGRSELAPMRANVRVARAPTVPRATDLSAPAPMTANVPAARVRRATDRSGLVPRVIPDLANPRAIVLSAPVPTTANVPAARVRRVTGHSAPVATMVRAAAPHGAKAPDVVLREAARKAVPAAASRAVPAAAPAVASRVARKVGRKAAVREA